MSHAEGSVTQSIRSAFTAAIDEFATDTDTPLTVELRWPSTLISCERL